MCKFIVLDESVDHRRVALLDEAGQLHVARVLADTPPVGMALVGVDAGRGTAVLTSVESGAQFPVEYLLVCGDYRLTFQRLHRPGPAATQGSVSSTHPATNASHATQP
jgi:hypothetical protein